MPAECFFREYLLAIDDNLKYTPTQWHELPCADVIFQFAFGQHFFRQTDGARGVISRSTIFDDDVYQTELHDHILFYWLSLYPEK